MNRFVCRSPMNTLDVDLQRDRIRWKDSYPIRVTQKKIASLSSSSDRRKGKPNFTSASSTKKAILGSRLLTTKRYQGGSRTMSQGSLIKLIKAHLARKWRKAPFCLP